MNPKPAATHVALTGAYEADYRMWGGDYHHGLTEAEWRQAERNLDRIERETRIRRAVRAIFWGTILLAGVALTVYGLVTWA